MKDMQTTIKKSTLLITILFLQLLTTVTLGNNPAGNQTNVQSLVVVNEQMIERFNNCETDGMLVSWSDLVIGFEHENLSNLLFAYLNADFETQTLDDIKLSLENKQTEHLNNSDIGNDLAWYNQVKQEINNKLRAADVVAGR